MLDAPRVIEQRLAALPEEAAKAAALNWLCAMWSAN